MARKSLGNQICLLPMPVLAIATYNEDGTVDVMTAAWGGICQETPPGIMIDLAKEHNTTKNIKRAKAFTVGFATVDTIAETDFFGTVSGNKDAKKFEKTGFHAVKSDCVDAPLVLEYKLALECKLLEMKELPNDCRVVGEIVNLNADESILTDGKIDTQKLQPVAWNCVTKEYVKFGESVGLAWNVGKEFLTKRG